MQIKGHFVHAEFDDRVLRVRGTSTSSRIDLAGNGHGWGDLVLPVAQIRSIRIYPASRFSAGHLLVHDTNGGLHRLRFRHRESRTFHGLAFQLYQDLEQQQAPEDGTATRGGDWGTPR